MISLLRQGLMLALLAGWAPLVLSQAERFNMDIRLGFFDGSDPPADPTFEELSGLICATQVFLSKVLQNTTGDNTVTIEARDISYTRGVPVANDTEFQFSFWGNFSTAPGGTPPTRDEVIAAFDMNNPAFNATEYITDYAAPSTPLGGSGSYFSEVNSMSYNGTYGLPREGTYEEAVCEVTEAPTYPPTNATDDSTSGNQQTDSPQTTDSPQNTSTVGPNSQLDLPPPEDEFGNGTFAPGAATPAPGPLFGNGTFSPDAYGNGTFNPELLETPAPAPSEASSRPPVFGESQYLEPDEEDFGNGTFAPGAPTPAPNEYFNNGTFSPEAYNNGTFNPELFGDSTFSPDGDIDVDGTEAPSDTNSAANTNDMVYFTLQYRFTDGNAEEPREDAMKSLICKTNLFFRDELRNHTGDEDLQVEATNINWSFDEDRMEPLELTFTANVTTNDYSNVVPVQTVFDGMQVTTEDILRYIEFYIWESEPTLYWSEVNAANFTNEAQVPVPVGRLPTYQCPATEAPTMAPTISAMPTSSPAPSGAPTTTPMPTSSVAPSLSPSVSSSPTASPVTSNRPVFGSGEGIYDTSAPDGSGGPGGPGGPSVPTISPMPTVSPAPTTGPTVSAAPTITPMPTEVGGPAVRQSITAKFLVSNIADISAPEQVNSSGLSASWPVFANEVVQNITAARNRRNLRAGGRRLAVGIEPGSARIEEIEPIPCPDGSHEDAICHNSTASYVLLLQGDEEPGQVEFEYGTDTIAAVDDGRYQAVLDRVDPDSPLVIGTIPESDDGGMPVWQWILIILLFLLCCLCIVLAVIFMKKKGDEEKQLEPYDEEGFVYDFLIPPNEKPQTEVDDDATKAVDLDEDGEGDDEEEFNEDQDDEDKEEFREDVAEVEAENLEDIDGSEGEVSEGEQFEDEDEARAAELEEVEDETTPLAIMGAEEEAPPSSEEDEPEPVEESSEHEEAPAAEQWDDETEPQPEAEEPEASASASEEAAEPELAEVASDGEPEAAGSGEEEGWDEDQEGGEAAAAEEEGWDEDASGGEQAAAEAEEWDDDNEAGGEDENWEDEEGVPEAAGSDDDWDDEDAK